MKRLIPLILLLSLLCACAPGTEAPAPTATPTPMDNGLSVHIDYSGYSPYEPPEAKYTRLSDEWIENLAPRADYGTLYPFMGTKLYSSSQDGYTYENGALYGLFDENGRIVADATYAEITRLDYYDYASNKSHTCPFLLLSRGVCSNTVETDYGEYYEGSAIYALASLDGKFVTECKYGYIRGFAEGVLCAASYESEEFVLYDNYGNILMTEKDVPFEDFWCGSISYDEGIISMNSSRDYDSGYYYLDIDGNILHGPYQSITPYSCGTAVVCFYGEDRYSIIDRAGQRTSPFTYDFLTSQGDGQYVHYDSEGVCSIIRANGAVVFSTDTDTLFETSYGYCGWKYTDTSSICYFFDKDGNLLLDSTETEWTEVYGTPLAECQLDNGVAVINIATGEQLFIPGADYVWPMYTDTIIGDLPKTINYVAARDIISGNNIILDYTPAKVLEQPVEFMCIVVDELTGEEYIYLDDILYDKGLNIIGRYPTINRIYGGRIMYSDETCFTCTDMDGNVLFRYNFVMSGGD